MHAQIRQSAIARGRGELGYPPGLLDLQDPPPSLWTVGQASSWPGPWIAIVGSRSADLRGARAARELAELVVGAGGGVISGGAMGIDAAAHEGALDAGGPTVVVLAGGIDRPGPRYNEALFRRVLAGNGGFWSERPLGATARRGAFIRRNRLIAAGARAVVVVQAHRRSGSLSTAAHAQRLDRPLWVVPGGYGDEARRGCNWLLSQGAMPLTSAGDLESGLAAMGGPEQLSGASISREVRTHGRELSEAEQAVLTALLGGARELDEVVAVTGYPVKICLAAITCLELAGKWSP